MMKNRKPLKRSKALIEFSRDHHFGLLMVWKIRKGLQLKIEPARIGRYAVYFYENDLDVHFSEEETLLFDQLDPVDSLRTRAEYEHARVRQYIETLRARPADADTLRLLSDLVETHIRFEERELFPYIEAKVGEEKLLELAKHAAPRERDASEAWSDPFWA